MKVMGELARKYYCKKKTMSEEAISMETHRYPFTPSLPPSTKPTLSVSVSECNFLELTDATAGDNQNSVFSADDTQLKGNSQHQRQITTFPILVEKI